MQWPRLPPPNCVARFSDTLNRVVYQGERVAVERYGKTVAALVSADDLELLEALEKPDGPQGGPESAEGTRSPELERDKGRARPVG